MTIKREIEIDIKEEIGKMAFSKKYRLMLEIAQENFDVNDYLNLIKDSGYTIKELEDEKSSV